jgi:hypothetical protein
MLCYNESAKKKRAVNPYSVKELMKGQKGYSIGD